MNSLLAFAALVAVVAPPLQTLETPHTRLFVRTIPPGAKVVLDGEVLGESDGLFLVPSGVRKITVELDGYHPAGRQVRLRDGWITRVELELSKRPEPPDRPSRPRASPDASAPREPSTVQTGEPNVPADPAAGSQAAAAYVSRADVAEPVRAAMLTVLRQHPGETRWSGRAGPTLFAVAVKSLPGGPMRQRATPALLELTHMLAVQEVLKAKSLLDRYAATGLDDATTLRQAVEEAAGKLEVSGKVKGLVHQATVQDEFAVGYVIGEESSLTAHLLEPAALEKVQVAYRLVMHRQARALMEREDWSEALLLWQHLHQRKLVSQALYLDAARCLKQLEKPGDAVQVLNEALESFGDEATLGFLEQAGDVALSIQTDEAQDLAVRAYERACDKMSLMVSEEPSKTDSKNTLE
ncbi:MAG TPA: PEGA domain-containing protein [Thermoguttaceae bacterium]|nr:PEGA domain-containing protein [Thermoguttaceae bacterium]